MGPAWCTLAITGNHDHWPGRACSVPHAITCMLGVNTNPQSPRMQLRRMPWIEHVDLGKATRLAVIGIDTDKDVNPNGRGRFLARGGFESQLQDAEQLFADHPPPEGVREVRVMVLHHSPAHPGPALAVRASSKAALLAFLAKRRVRALFTGHTHARAQVTHALPNGGHVIELGAGTTTALDRVPSNGVWAQVSSSRLALNTCLLHEFRADEAGAILTTTTYQRTRGGASFDPQGTSPPTTLVYSR